MLKSGVCVMLSVAAIGAAVARPFTATDLARLDRVSDPPCVSRWTLRCL